ncbi:MAG: PAS domain S-box protein [Chitinivibrionales bacterium]|nr:PAS domain S-box protein [Chitinivibrionales bacterium]MBD3358913.1 PAS domain S-box protein [Chitinivibrionales bacterium]
MHTIDHGTKELRKIFDPKAVLEPLRQENAQLRHIFEFLPDAAFVIDEHKRVTHWNKAAESMTGVKKESLLGTRDYSLAFYKTHRPILVDMLDLDDEVIRREYDYVNRVGVTINAETFVPHFNNGNGAYIWIAAAALYAPDGKPAGAIEVVRDVSDRRLAENRLRISEERFHQLANNVKDVFRLFDLEWDTLLFVSPAYRQVWGRPPEKAGNTLAARSDHILEEDKAIEETAFTAVCRGEKPSAIVEFRIRRPDLTVRWIRTEYFAVTNEKNIVHRIAAVSTDITPFKEAAAREHAHQQQLIQADKMASLGVLVAGVAHEINNPTNYITLSTPLLRKAWETIMPIVEERFTDLDTPCMGTNTYTEFAGTMDYLLRSIEDGASRIKRIVTDLKEYARLDNSKTDEEVDVNKIVESAVNLMGSHIKKQTKSFSLSLSDIPAPCKGNFQRLEQVMINLIQNACDALTTNEQPIHVSTTVSDKTVDVVVHDEGKGIPKDLISKVQDPFFTTKRDSGGTGLGLSVTAGIIQEHGGTIDIESKTGFGSTVTVKIPRSLK